MRIFFFFFSYKLGVCFQVYRNLYGQICTNHFYFVLVGLGIAIENNRYASNLKSCEKLNFCDIYELDLKLSKYLNYSNVISIWWHLQDTLRLVLWLYVFLYTVWNMSLPLSLRSIVRTLFLLNVHSLSILACTCQEYGDAHKRLDRFAAVHSQRLRSAISPMNSYCHVTGFV